LREKARMRVMTLANQGAPNVIEVGQPAPDFTLIDHNRREVSLGQYRGVQNVVLSFFVFAFTDN
jgi:peroxiredoxin